MGISTGGAMGKASRAKRARTLTATELDSARESGRYVPYQSLLRTGRAVRYHNLTATEQGGWWIEVQLAGEQGADNGPRANRSFWVAFDTETSARNTGSSLLSWLQEREHEGKINTDVAYNRLVRGWAVEVQKKVANTNLEVLQRAERMAQRAPSSTGLLGWLTRRKHKREEHEDNRQGEGEK